MSKALVDEDVREHIIFVGETLGPFFLEDPAQGTIEALFEALRTSNPQELGAAWPFVEDAQATHCLVLMHDGLQAEAPGSPTSPSAVSADDNLSWEYRRLFIGPAKKPAPPWGSVYTDRECVIFGGTTLELREWMRKNGIERMGDSEAPEDHIGLMLVLMAWLANCKPEMLDEYLSEHLFTWSSHFLDQLAQAAEHPFYEGLALLTKESLEGIQSTLELSVEYPRYYR